MMNYDTADRAVRAMNRENLKTFGRLKTRLMKADELHVIREVTDAYDALLGLAKRWFLVIGREAYAQGMKDANRRKRNAIDRDWILDWLEETDFVTLYKFSTEWERKKARLIEALPVTPDRGREIDKALKEWTRQIAQATIDITDDATKEAYRDAGVREVEWVVPVHDARVCDTCEDRDGVLYRLDEVPVKHPNCRCILIPVL